MKKFISTILFILMATLVLLNINTSTTNAQIVSQIKIHYHRFDHNYTGWDNWVWEYQPSGKDGKTFPFDGTDEFGVVASFNITEIAGYDASNPPTVLGFIIKKGNWTDREPGGDRYIHLSNPDAQGNVEVYLIEGDTTVYTERSQADISPRISNATFSNFQTIQFETTDTIDSTDLVNLTKVYQDGQQVGISNVSLSGNTKGTVTLNDKITITSDYTLQLPGFNKQVYISKTSLYDTTEFVTNYTYTGTDLGATYTKDYTEFKVWAPTASDMSLVLYSSGNYANGSILDQNPPSDLLAVYQMNRSDQGTWTVKVNGDLNKTYYTYKVTIGNEVNEVVDPYAKAVGVNGNRGMVIDLPQTNPSNWNNQKPTLMAPEDSIIYELHIRDLSIFRDSNITNKGKYLGLTEKGTMYNQVTTGLSHLIELGITHLHILPAFDFRSIDETSSQAAFNWGYDPLNYNAPEGSYSTDPYHGEVRINEFKQMVQALHDNGIRVVMDVVYNHLGDASTSSFQKLVPNYYFRTNSLGQFTNGSGVGNETASERAMMRKFMIDSVSYWANEYHVDGFRFDLMAVHDIETMNKIREATTAIDPSIIIYGEGWTGGTSALPEAKQASRFNVSQMPGIGVFNDVTRDGIKGSVFSATDKGFIQGAGKVSDVMFGIVGGITHPQTRAGWANDPEQIINYVSAHDNYTLYDKITLSEPDAVKQLKVYQDKQAAAIILTSQGIPFMQAGQDFLRSKPESGSYSGNSYNAPDRVNQLRWDYKADNIDVFNYYKGLISLRKAHPAFRMRSADDIRKNLVFIDTSALQNVIAYTLNNANNDPWNTILIAFNGSSQKQTITLPKNGNYHIVVNKDQAGTEIISSFTGSQLKINPNESIVAYIDSSMSLPHHTYWLIIIPSIIGVGLLGSLFYFRKKR